MRKGLPTISGRGFLVSKGVELAYTNSGKAYARLPLAFSQRRKDERTDEWVTDKEILIQGTAWGPLAEYLAQELQKEHGEIDVAGEIYLDKYTNKSGEEVESIKMTVTAAGVVEARDSNRSSSKRSKPAEDPWASAPASKDPWAGADDEPPF